MKKLVLLTALALSACVSSQEIAQREINECVSLGFKPNTEAFGQCRLQLRSISAQRLMGSSLYYNNSMPCRP